jgi:hypothetical protein
MEFLGNLVLLGNPVKIFGFGLGIGTKLPVFLFGSQKMVNLKFIFLILTSCSKRTLKLEPSVLRLCRICDARRI